MKMIAGAIVILAGCQLFIAGNDLNQGGAVFTLAGIVLGIWGVIDDTVDRARRARELEDNIQQGKGAS